MLCISSKNKRPGVIIYFCFFDSLSMHYMDFGVLLEFSYDSRKVFLRIYSILQPKLNDDPQVETQLNKWANNCHISSLFFLLYFSFSFQAWDSICFYCCWCLTLLDTFVIGEVRWEPQSCYETNTLWSEYKNYVQNLWGLFFHSRNYRK